MASPLVFPSYLLSHALSTSHYSLLKRIEAASSSRELNSICFAELDRLRSQFSKGKLSDASAKEALVLLLLLDAAGSRTEDLSFGLVPALNLAEAGKDIKARQMGYLFLNEHLTAKNDLSLLLFNTMLKDLQSAHIPSVVLALKSIISVPSVDIAPAVEHQLVHLVSHKSSNVRRLALAALLSLARVSSSKMLAGLKERKIWKRLIDSDPAVVLHSVRVLAQMESSGLVDSLAAFPAMAQALRQIVERPSSESSLLPLATLQIEIIRTLDGMFERLGSSQKHELLPLLQPLLYRTSLDSSLDAIILPLYSLFPKLLLSSISSTQLIPLLPIRRALLSSQPNGHLWALRCLAVLPASSWADDSAEEGGLGEQAMTVLMSGLESRDNGIRVETLKILRTLSPDIPALQLERITSLLASSTSSFSLREKEAIIARALEIVELLYSLETEQGGQGAASKVWEVLEAGQLRDDASKSELVLEDAASRILGWIPQRSSDWRASFVSTLLDLSSSLPSGSPLSSTLTILIAATACEYPPPVERKRPEDICLALATLLEGSLSPSIQEALLISLVGVSARLNDGRSDPLVVEAIESLKKKSGKHLRHRCDAFLFIAVSSQAFSPLRSLLADDSSLPTVLQTFEAHAATLAPQLLPRSSSANSNDTLSPSPRTNDISASTLRYDAYPAAKAEESQRKKEKRERKEEREKRRERERERERGRLRDRTEHEDAVGLTAGELALLDVNNGGIGGEEPARPSQEPSDDTDPFQVSPDKVRSDLITLAADSPFLESPTKGLA